MAQTSIAAPAVGIEGNLSSNRPGCTIVAKELSHATPVPFGRVVAQDTDDDAARLPSAAGDFFVGVALQDPTQEADLSGVRRYEQYDEMAVLEDGEVWLLPEQSVSPGDPVYVRVTAGGAGQTPGRVRKDADETLGVKRQQTLTLSGALDGGRKRVQRLTFNQAMVAAETVDLNVDGQAIAQQTFTSDSDRTLENIVEAIKVAGRIAGAGIGGASSIVAAYVVPVGATASDDRIIEIVSIESATSVAITGIVIGTAAGLTLSLSEVTAGAAPHSLSVQLDGGAALVQEWRGTSDATLHAFAALLEAQAAIESAVVTGATDTGGGIDDAERVITVTAATAGPSANAFTNPTVAGGQNARTLAVAETVAGVAAVAAKAVLWTGAIFKSTGSSSALARVGVKLP